MENSSGLQERLEDVAPRWDVTVLYPSLESDEFAAAFARTISAIKDLVARFDRDGIARVETASATDSALIARFESLVSVYNQTLEAMTTLRAYVMAFVTTDSRNSLAQARMSELRRENVSLGLLGTRFSAWIGSLDLDSLIAASPVAREHEYFLRQTAISAAHLLPQSEEVLVAELGLSGSSAWAKLHGDLTSQLTVPLDGENLPMSVIRGLASSPDRELRKRAYHAEIAAWERVSLPLCAAMNSIKNESNVLAERRGWGSVLDVSLFYNKIDRDTLDAMMSAALASFPDFRRYLCAKARYISGSDRLPWYDLFAPIGTSDREWRWSHAEQFIGTQFGTYSSDLQEFALRAFREKWVDAEPRPGKRDGAFCMGVRPGESRILQNYKPSFAGVSTLAHELGHGYHNACLKDRTPLQRGTPMTLAETASIFCETVIRQAVLHDGEPGEQLSILDDAIQGSCQVVVDIMSRFQFEQAVLDGRRRRELSADEMCGMMLDAQRSTYGNGLDDSCLHPYMWAVKGHYYGSSFYNFPYMFGLLFGLGLYAIYESDPDNFRARYDALLSRTGMASTAELAREFGIDIRDVAFWTRSLDHVRRDIDRFEALTRGKGE